MASMKQGSSTHHHYMFGPTRPEIRTTRPPRVGAHAPTSTVSCVASRDSFLTKQYKVIITQKALQLNLTPHRTTPHRTTPHAVPFQHPWPADSRQRPHTFGTLIKYRFPPLSASDRKWVNSVYDVILIRTRCHTSGPSVDAQRNTRYDGERSLYHGALLLAGRSLLFIICYL